MSKMSELALDVQQVNLDDERFKRFIETFNSVRWDYQQQSYGVWKENSDKVDWMRNLAGRNPEYRALYARLHHDLEQKRANNMH